MMNRRVQGEVFLLVTTSKPHRAAWAGSRNDQSQIRVDGSIFVLIVVLNCKTRNNAECTRIA